MTPDEITAAIANAKSQHRCCTARIDLAVELEKALREPQWEFPCPGDGPHPSYWKTVVTSPQWAAWQKEHARRFHDQRRSLEAERTRLQLSTVTAGGAAPPPVAGGDEHFQEFLKFTVAAENEVLRARVAELEYIKRCYHDLQKRRREDGAKP